MTGRVCGKMTVPGPSLRRLQGQCADTNAPGIAFPLLRLYTHLRRRRPRKNRFDASYSVQGAYALGSPKKSERGLSTESARSRVSSTYREDDSNWQSSELRESMERARQAYLQRNRAS